MNFLSAISLAPATQSAPPQSQQSFSEHRESVEVSWYRVVVEVTLHDRFEPCPGLRNGIVHTLAELLLNLLQLCSHALTDRHAPHGERPFPILSADVRKAQKVKRLRFSFTPLFPVSFGKPPELDPARLVGMELQSKLSQSFSKVLQETIRFGLVLES